MKAIKEFIPVQALSKPENPDERVRQLAAILDIIPDAVVVTDNEGRIIYWNQGASDLFVWTYDEVFQRPIHEIFTISKSDLVSAVKLAGNKRFWSGEHLLRTKTGDARICFCRVSSLKDAFEMPTCYLFVSTDITEKKKLDEASAQQQRMESLGRMAGSISHDLNNIFTPILLSVEMLKLDANNSAMKEALEKINNYMRKGTKLIHRVLELSNGKIQSFEPEVLNLKQVMDEILNLIRESLGESIELQSSIADESISVWGDSNQMFQVFMNLLLNARDAMPNGGRLGLHIESTVFEGRNWVRVDVSDTGVGIKSEDLDKIFEPFFTTKKSGTGIGLATVKSIVKQHRGFINVKSEVGFGTTFTVSFPAYAHDKKVNSKNQKRPTILVIDDEEEIRFITERILKSANYNVIVADSGSRGLEILVERFSEINTIVTDMRMPNMNGIQLIEAARKVDPACKVIVISANEFAEYRRILDQKDMPIQGYLRKPFKKEELVQIVNHVTMDYELN